MRFEEVVVDRGVFRSKPGIDVRSNWRDTDSGFLPDMLLRVFECRSKSIDSRQKSPDPERLVSIRRRIQLTFADEELVSALGDAATNQVVERFRQFAYLPRHLLGALEANALAENWGPDSHLLEKYLAVHVAWSVEQGRVTRGEGQFYTTAGHLQTRYGTPLYLAFAENLSEAARQPYRVVAAGSQIAAPEYPTPPDIPSTPPIEIGSEIVMMHDHILDDNAHRVPFFRDTPRVAQMCAIAGAIQWSLNRGLQLPQWYYGQMSYIVPLYLASREDIAATPDLIAPIQVSSGKLLVRTLMEPYMAYASARVAVSRHDQLPHWLLSVWERCANEAMRGEYEPAIRSVTTAA